MKRVTLEEIGKKHLIFHVPKKVEIEGQEIEAVIKKEYELDFEAGVAKGGTCLVYHAYKLVKSSEGFLKHKVILKEFYPELEAEDVMIVRCEDGSLEISEAVKEEDVYRAKLERFWQSYEMFVNLHNEKKTNNYVVNADELIEANGTWYLVIDYNEACTLSEYIKKQPNLYEFCQVLKRSTEAVSVLHKAGYLHLDLTPGNLMVFQDGCVRLLDTDSFLRKDELKSKRPVLSWSEGYAAPELFSPRAYQRLSRLGERSDIFSLGAILYRYLYGAHFEGIVDEKSLEEKIKEKYALNQEGLVKCPQNAMRILKEFISIALSEEMGCRYETMKEVEGILEGLLTLIEPKRIQLLDNFRKNTNYVYGREEKIKELEDSFLKQGQQRKHRLVLISGIGGIGKSTLARAYAEKYLDQYDTIVEVAAESAEEVVRSIGIINFDDNDLDERMCVLQALLQERRSLIIVHDYNQREDESFALFKALSCDVILTSWADWKESGVSCIALKSTDLTEQAAVSIFEEIYLENAQTDSEILKAMLARERESLKILLHQVDYHPLTIKLLAKQMSYLSGAEQTPSQMLRELEQYGISENHDITFQNQKDGGNVELGNVFFHLQRIYGMALQNGRLTEDEIEVLRYMMLLSGENGVCIRRFTAWSHVAEDKIELLCIKRKGIDAAKVLTALCKKGWIEYRSQEIDELWLEVRRYVDWLELFKAEDKEFWDDLLREVKGEKKETKRYRDTWLEEGIREAKGVYHMPMCISQVLHSQEQMKSTISNSYYLTSVLGECKIYIEYFKKYSTVKYILEYVENLCRYIQEEQRESYAIFLVECSLIKLQCTFSKAQKESALKMLEMATQMRLKLVGEEGHEFYVAYRALAEGYFYHGQYEKAIDYAKKALQYEQWAGPWKYVGRKLFYDLLIDSYLELGNYKNAEEYLGKQSQIKQGNYESLVMTKFDWAEFHARLGRIESLKENDFRAIEYWEQAREEYVEKDSFQLQYWKRIADIDYALAKSYWKTGWKSRAIICLESSLQFYDQGNAQTELIKKLLEEYRQEFKGQKDDVRTLKRWYCEQLKIREPKDHAQILKRLKELEQYLNWWEKIRLKYYLKLYKK